jgi:hypothetical protein
MTHDPACCLSDMPATECPVCESITLARDEERAKYQEVWKTNLPLIERRNYEQGFHDGRESR